MLTSTLPAKRSKAPDRNGDGFFLVGVLAFCFILIPVIAIFAQSSRAVVRSTKTESERFKLEFLASGLAEALASKLTSDHDLTDRFRDGGPVSCEFQDMQFSFGIQDHDGKIDLNNAGSELLKIGFEAAGLSDENAELLQQYAEAFRSNSFSPDAASALSSLPSLKHAPFERVEELNDAVAALKLPAIEFEPYFTVYKRAGNLEYETAAKLLKARIDAEPELKDQLAADNGSFDYVDVVAEVSRNGRRYSFLKTYARLAVAGEVREMAGKELPIGAGAPPEGLKNRTIACESLIGFGKGPTANG